MSEVSIRARGLGKQYYIGRRERYRSLRDTLTDVATAPFRRVRQLLGGHATGAADLHESLWALKDISFEIARGEVVGVIGRNGAGKSTLLKILSRITSPTEGSAEIYGRVGSLLEVGTGFHPELTGRENLYLNGAILGMRKPEIDRKFDEIVAFAEIEKFVDTPVKHYSSGMYLRLAFSVAAHLEPEILLVDEVLAVGDATFQKKCLGKMGEVAGQGRTVLLVSHNMAAIANLCRLALLLDAGRVCEIGPTADVINSYMKGLATQLETPLGERRDRKGNGRMRLEAIAFQDSEGAQTTTGTSGERGTFAIDYVSRDGGPLPKVMVQMHILDHLGTMLFTLSTRFSRVGKFDLLPPRGTVCCDVEVLPLASGSYTVSVGCEVNSEYSDYVAEAFRFDVVAGDFFGTGTSPVSQRHGCFLVAQDWRGGEPRQGRAASAPCRSGLAP